MTGRTNIPVCCDNDRGGAQLGGAWAACRHGLSTATRSDHESHSDSSLRKTRVLAGETRAALPTVVKPVPELYPDPEPDPELGATGWLLGLREGEKRTGPLVGKAEPVKVGAVAGAVVGAEVAAGVGATDDTAALPF